MVLLEKCNTKSVGHEDDRTELNQNDVKSCEISQLGLIEISLSRTTLNQCPRCRRYTSTDGSLCYLCGGVKMLK